MVDYIIVGFGLAGLNITKELEERQKTFQIYDNNSHTASTVAGGIINPLILKRFTKAWRVDDFLPVATKRYLQFNTQFKKEFFNRLPIYRKIKSVREQNDWFAAADKKSLTNYMNATLQQIEVLKSPFKYGEVEQTWSLDTKALINTYRTFLQEKKLFKEEQFDYRQLKINSEYVQYKNSTSKKIIFCEGIHLLQNPYFKDLPLIGNKGDYLVLKIPNLNLKSVLKTAVALIPLGNDFYKFGATYSRDYQDFEPEEESRNFLIKKLEEIIDQPYTIVNQISGVRPTVLDRRPFIGTHRDYKNILILNGLGSHGIMMAPLAAQWLIDFDLEDKPLPKVVDVQRYPK